LKGGVVLSLERLNSIIRIEPVNRYIIAESGVITSELCDFVAAHGLYFPVAPSSSRYSFIGGNVAENAGSIQSCRYGTTDKYVLNAEVVLPSGKIIWTGANVAKNVSGLNLTQLFVGSEGTLGIITKIVYRLISKPALEVSLLSVFSCFEDACRAVVAIRQSRLQPSAAELIGEKALRITAAYLNEPLAFLQEDTRALLLVDLQDETEQGLFHSMEIFSSIIEAHTKGEILVARTAMEKEQLWKIRFSIGAALTAGNKRYRDIDICVPLSVLNQYVKKVEEIGDHYGIPVACFGHALDGNLHTMLMLNDKDDPAGEEDRRTALREIYSYAIDNGGVISGEHGIGMLQKEFMPLQFPAGYLHLLNGIKQLFDPNNILNPGKLY